MLLIFQARGFNSVAERESGIKAAMHYYHPLASRSDSTPVEFEINGTGKDHRFCKQLKVKIKHFNGTWKQ